MYDLSASGARFATSQVGKIKDTVSPAVDAFRDFLATSLLGSSSSSEVSKALVPFSPSTNLLSSMMPAQKDLLEPFVKYMTSSQPAIALEAMKKAISGNVTLSKAAKAVMPVVKQGADTISKASTALIPASASDIRTYMTRVFNK